MIKSVADKPYIPPSVTMPSSTTTAIGGCLRNPQKGHMTCAILTCSPYFRDLALNELQRHHPHLRIGQTLSQQNILLKNPSTFDHLTRPWRHKLPIYLHHLFPVHQIVNLDGTTDDLPYLKEVCSQWDKFPYIAQVRHHPALSLDYSDCELETYIPTKVANSPTIQEPRGRILSILILPTTNGLQAFIGMSWGTQNISGWKGGRCPIVEPVANRAGYKLIEALRTFGIKLHPRGPVLDLGASPGAWTEVLLRRNQQVTAVAPTPMYHWLDNHKDVDHVPLIAEAYLLKCQMSFDVITNDMILDAQYSAWLMVEYARFLRSRGIAIMTLKLRQHNQRRVMDHSYRILRKIYKIIGVRQLVSNRREVTLLLQKKS